MDEFEVIGGRQLYQWDTDRSIEVRLCDGEIVNEVHYAHAEDDVAPVVKVQDYDGRMFADIPNILLQRFGTLKVWAVVYTEDGRQTLRNAYLSVRARAKPDDYVYTETEIMDYRKVAEDLAELVQRVEEIEENGVQGGGAVASVNGKTGEVYLNAADVGALPTTGGKLTGNLTVPRLISTAADADGNIYEVQLYPTANGGLYMPLRHNGAVANAMSMSQSATTFGKPVAISSGGHGGKNAAEGRQNLSLYSKEEIDEKITNTQKEIERLTEEIGKNGKPRVYIYGVIPTTKDDVLAELTYEHGPERWHAYITIKCQGSSSMAYPKKNFTIKLYSDEARTVKLKKKMFGWPVAQYKYVLKANWIDHTHARNIVTARLWSEVVASRPDYNSLPEELRNSPNNGAIDGYPIVVYTNGTYQGLYTWNIGKDDWMWGMDEDNPNHVLMCAETNTNGVYRETPCNFRTLWSGVHDQDWSVEVGTNSEAVKNSLNALITCVKDTDDATFKATIGNYLDATSAIDYYLLTCADCGIDSLGRNLLIGTYDLQKWYCGKYDLDSTWLLWWDGYKFIPANTDCPVDYQECFSLLWSRIRTVFWKELKERGIELRRSVLTYANIVGHFERFCASIGSEAYADDIVAYSTIPSASTNNIWQIRNGVRDRLAYFDAWLDSIWSGVSCEGVSINNDGDSNILKGEQKTFSATVMPSNATEQVIWSSSDEKTIEIDRKTGQMTAVDVGSAVITAVCGKHTSTYPMSVFSNGDDVLYHLQSEATLDGTRATCIDTGVKIVDADKDFTIAIDVTPAARNGDDQPRYLYQNNNTMYGGKNPGFRMASMAWPYLYGFTSIPNQSADVEILSTAKDDVAERSVIVVRHAKGSGEASVTSCYEGTTETKTGAMPDDTFLDFNCNNLWIGAHSAHSEVAATNFFVGTVHRCDVYNRVLSDDEVTAFIDGMN